jgi:DNA polymerase III psi subunit
MPLPDPASHARLAAMEIEVWSQRRAHRPVQDDLGGTLEPRVRLSSGEGRWLLVQRRPWDGEHAQLVSDITALLGVDQCRFGQWSGEGAAGVALSELSGRGIDRVLAFGRLPATVDSTQVVQAAELDELAVSALARRALWRALRPCLAD